jgi:hypothetical protein
MKEHKAFFVLALLLLTPCMLYAEKDTDDVMARYKAALSRNEGEQAVSIVCEAAKTDPKKYEKRCSSAQQDLNKQLFKLDSLFNTGKSELEHKDYGAAVRDLSKITFGVHRVEAQHLIQEANDAQGHPQLLAADKITFGVAQAAYLRGDLPAAKLNASQVKVSELLPLAQQMLNNIRTYEEAIQQGDAAMQEGNYTAAQQKYTFAVAINANGPGNPAAKLQQLATLASAPKKPAVKVTPATGAAANLPPSDGKKAEVPSAADNAEKIKAALAEARTAAAANNAEAAIAAYDRVLSLNPRLPEAVAGRQKLLDGLQKDVQSLEVKLAVGIRSYYRSQFTESAAALSLYLNAGGERYKGAAHFYLGATLATRALLLDPQNDADSKTLEQRALLEFQLARREHYQPVQKYIAPRVLALWNESPG